MVSSLRDFLEIPYDQLEEMNLAAKQERMARKAVDKVREARLKYLTDEKSCTADEIRAALRKGTITRQCFPVFCGSALKFIGVQRLLDGVIDYLPNPTEAAEVEGVESDAPADRGGIGLERAADVDALGVPARSRLGDVALCRVLGRVPRGGRGRRPSGAAAGRRPAGARAG